MTADPRRDALRLVADQYTAIEHADTIACVVLPNVNIGSRWATIARLRLLSQRIDRLECAQVDPLRYSLPLPGEDRDAHRTREINIARGQLDVEIGAALLTDDAVGASDSIPAPRSERVTG
ncbi:MAG: hypothetical protein LC798_10955 [Chloroflexi bacterium]|nr:hypothetical protein [Chloroflexota bacterium]